MESVERNFNQEEIAALEKQHPGLKKVQVDDGKLVCFKKPDRTLIGQANAVLSSTKNPQKYADIILKNTQLNWQDATATDDELYYALVPLVDSLITAKTAELVN
jgi:hypothetical protein